MPQLNACAITGVLRAFSVSCAVGSALLWGPWHRLQRGNGSFRSTTRSTWADWGLWPQLRLCSLISSGGEKKSPNVNVFSHSRIFDRGKPPPTPWVYQVGKTLTSVIKCQISTLQNEQYTFCFFPLEHREGLGTSIQKHRSPWHCECI